MATAAANPLLRFEDSNGDPLAGGTLEFYESGSSTPKTAYGDSSESTSFTTKTLDSRGEAVVYFGSGNYKLIVKDSGGSTIKTLDPVIGAVTSVTQEQWVASGDTPTYVSATSFTVPGDKTADYHTNRAFKATVTAGTVYGHYTGSSYSDPNTTVTVKNDSGTLDSGLSAVWHGLETANDSAVPRIYEGSMRVIGCNCANNSTTPNTQFDLDADAIVLRNSKNQTVTIWEPGSAITNNISTAGPAANGRDQAGAFSNSSWVHFYWIWNGTTLASLSSATAPPTGPTLPSGYTHWAYAGADYLDSGGALKKVRIKGSMVFYESFARPLNSTSVGTTEANLDISASIPPNALSSLININAGIATSASGAAASIAEIRVVTGLSFIITVVHASTASLTIKNSTGGFVPNIGQNLIYLFTSEINPTNIAQRQLAIDVCGFTIPNGGE
jgi:hypothetical protein